MRKIITYLLTILLIMALSVHTFAVEAPQSKEEVVYGILDNNGNLNEVYIVNSFQGGSIIDHGDYSKVLNLTNNRPLDYKNKTVSFKNEAETFYYQGTLATPVLPWQFEIKYFLDGEEIDAKDIVNQSGKLIMEIAIDRNPAVDPLYFENFMLQVTLTLNSELASNIIAPKATIANAGKNKVLAFTVLPGKKEFLTIKSEIKDFEMEGIQFAALPLNMDIDLPETNEMLGEMSQLTDAISSLNLGVSQFSGGISQTYQGSKKISAGSDQFAAGLSELNDNSSLLLNGSSQIKGALQLISSALDENMGDLNFDDLALLPPGLRQMADGLDEISAGMSQLKLGYNLAYNSLALAISGIPNEILDLHFLELSASVITKEHLRKTVNGLIQYYYAGQAVKVAHNLTKDTLGAMGGYLDEMADGINQIRNALRDVANSIETAFADLDISDALGELTDGMNQLANQYQDFHHGLKQYFDGVDSLDQGYQELNSGLKQLSGGLKELDSGAGSLASGTNLLHKETKQLPKLIEDKIKELVKEFDKSDYKPKSFASSKNTNVVAVQFVIKTKDLNNNQEPEEIIEEVIPPTFWDKLKDLFNF